MDGIIVAQNLIPEKKLIRLIKEKIITFKYHCQKIKNKICFSIYDSEGFLSESFVIPYNMFSKHFEDNLIENV